MQGKLLTMFPNIWEQCEGSKASPGLGGQSQTEKSQGNPPGICSRDRFAYAKKRRGIGAERKLKN